MVNSIFHDSKTGEVSEPTKRSGGIVFEFPTAEKPLICKLSKNPFNGDACVKINYFKHLIGNSEKYTRRHACRDSLGLGKSPEKDFFWDLVSKLKDLKQLGKEDTEEYKEAVALKKFFTPSERGYLFFVEPNSPNIKALAVGPMVFNRLFGRKKTEYRPEVPSLITQMSAKNLTPYLDADPEINKKGWIKIWKSGEGLATQYHMEPCVIEEQKVIDGQDVTITKFAEYPLSSVIASIIKGETGLDLDSCPDVIEFEKKQVWTEDESLTFVEAEGSVLGTPERLIKTDANDGEYKADTITSNDTKNNTTTSNFKSDEGKSNIAGSGMTQPVSTGVPLDEILF